MKTIIKKTKKHWFMSLLFTVLTFVSVSAQTNGDLRGTVSDEQGFLPGAHVILESTKHSVVTSMDGNYYFSNVEAGDYTIKVSYIGYNTYEESVSVSSTSTVVHNIKMEEGIESLDEITVIGNRGGQAKALNTQKESNTVKNVISEEQIKSFADLNTAEVLQRISGVTIQRDLGEGRFVAIRGTSPSLTNVTINGEQVAISSGENRRVELDVISADQLSGIEVVKVITPDMDGNAIGGSVNLKTRSAFDKSERLFNVKFGGGKSGNADKENWRTSIDFSDILGKNKKFGVSVNANWAVTNRVRFNNEHKWGDREDVNGDEISMALRNTEIQRSVNQRDRLGLNGQLEYRFNDKNRIYFMGMFNYRWDDQKRQKLRVRWDKGDYLSATEVVGARVLRSLHDRLEEQKVTSMMFGGEHRLGKVLMDYKFSTSDAFTKKDEGQLKPEFELRNVDLRMTSVMSKAPGWEVTNGVNLSDGSNFKFDALDNKVENTTNTVYTAALNFSIPMLLGADSGEFKFGAKNRSNSKDRKDIRQKWKWEGSNDLFLSQFETGGDDIIIHNNYNLGSPLDSQGFRDFFNANQGSGMFEATERPDVNFGEPYDAEESVTGVYFMTNQTYGKLLVTAGLRTEFTNTDYTGTHLVLNDGDFVSAGQTTVEKSYTQIFPNLQFRYRVTDNTNIRLAYSRGVSAPQFFDMTPYSITDIDDEETISGNGDLNPTTSNNFDLLGEHFFKGIGIVSGGLFLKDMDEFIFLSTGVVSGGEYDGFDFERPVNGAGARLFGYELTWQQQFTKLAGVLSGFGIYANYTHTSSSDIDLGPDSNRTDIDLLPYQMESVSNFALTYQKGGLTARVAVNFSGKFIEEVGEDNDNDEWREEFTQWDVSGSYDFSKGFSLFLEFSNIGNRPRYNYIGIPSRAREHSVNGISFNTGLRWSL